MKLMLITEADTALMNCAIALAPLSKCVSYNVACILARDNRILATGINGTPSGFENCNDKFPAGNCTAHHAWSNKHEIHAEQNAIAVASKHGIALGGAVAYCTLKPCMHCTKLLIAIGVSKIFYYAKYDRNDDTVLDILLQHANIKCICIK